VHAMRFAELWETLLPLGRDAVTGGYRRYSFTPADLACREWFASAAAQRGMRASTDRNGNLWAWWDAPGDLGGQAAGPGSASAGPGARLGGPGAGFGGVGAGFGGVGGAVVTGSHLDSVPDGGAFDGPLGVVSAFAAIDRLREQGFTPARPVAVAAFCEEEGGRFGLACLGSRLLTGAVQPAAARELRDGDGVTLAEAMAGAGLDPDGLGADEELLASVGAVVELHIEQGSALDGLGAAVGIAEGIWPHGRWRLDFTGRADHAGTTRLADRRDPMLPFAAAVLEARQAASAHGALATFGKVTAEPGAANAISSAVSAWLDARAPDQSALDRTVGQIESAARRAADVQGVEVGVRRESFTPPVEFDPALRARLAAALAAQGMQAPVLPTGAGHDAGVLAARLPAGMLFVRNRTGVSHSPAEHAEPADCEAGVAALAAVLAELAGR
jgi:beta-ureidopropionase / N-carbamoyl-L-amino-acid hydrolase